VLGAASDLRLNPHLRAGPGVVRSAAQTERVPHCPAATALFEGVMTAGAATDAVMNQVQANIVAAGYGR
jgi:Alpha-L-arabinofuranosidase B, catalytic